MKKLVLLFIAITLIGCEEKIINYDDITIVEDIAYFKNDMTNVTGKVVGHFENGQISFEGVFLEGKMEGAHLEWRKNGSKVKETNYNNGVIHGMLRWWYDNGQIWSETIYKNGKMNGIARTWYENGRQAMETNFIDDEKDGIEKRWNKNGQLEWAKKYRMGAIIID